MRRTDTAATPVETLDTADGGQVLFRQEGGAAGGWLVVRRLPAARGGRRCPPQRWDAPSRLALVLRVASVWGLDRS
jgi:hypothetical protein